MYDMIQGKFEDSIGRNVTGTKAKKLFTTDALFFLQHGAEHELQVSRGFGMLAFMKAKDKNGEQLKNEDGSDMNMFDAHINGDGISNVKEFLKHYNVAIIPNTMDDVITEAQLGSSLYAGQTLSMPAWIRYFNEKTRELAN